MKRFCSSPHRQPTPSRFPAPPWSLLVLLLLGSGLLGCVSQPAGRHQVPLIADGQTRQITTQATTVRDLLAEAGITLGPRDRVQPPEYMPLEEGMTVTVVRVEERQEVTRRPIPYETQVLRDASIPVGESRVLAPGENGIEEIITRVVYEDGVEVERQVVQRRIIEAPKPQIVLAGAQEQLQRVPISGTLVYISGSEEVGYNAWLMRGTNTARRRLTDDGRLDRRVFAPSPDGRWLLFTRVPTATPGLTPTATLPAATPALPSGRSTAEPPREPPFNSLWLLDLTVSNARPQPLGVENVLGAFWSPRGDRIAYTTGRSSPGPPGWQANNDLWIARVTASGELVGKRQVLGPIFGGAYGWWGTNYAWSPDGTTIAYAWADEIGIIPLRRARRETLYRFPPYRTYQEWVWVPEPSWSPDGRYLVAVLHDPPTGGLPGGAPVNPEDSPRFGIWVLSTDGEVAARLVEEAGMWALPRWSPERTGPGGEPESLIAFGRALNPYASENSLYAVYVMDRDGSNRRRVYPLEVGTTDEVPLLGPHLPDVAWSPDGSQLVIPDRGDLFLVDLTKQQVWQLTLDGQAQMPRWVGGGE